MSWKDDKDLGPWPFALQPNKWGYLNNPRWLDPPTVPVSYDGREDEEPQVWDFESGSPIASKTSDPMHTHIPCGHWHRPVSVIPTPTIYDVNLYRVTHPNNSSLHSLFFNTTSKTLSLGDFFKSSPTVSALETIDDTYIVTVKGDHATARLLVFDKDLNLISENNIFNYYDYGSPIIAHLNYYNGFIYWSSANEFSIIGRIAYPGYTRDSRFSTGGVYLSSDGKLWQYDYTYNNWWGSPVAYPITGDPGFYPIINNRILDDEHSGDVILWGSGTQGVCTGGTQSLHVIGGIIYIAASVSPQAKLYAYSTSDFSYINKITPPSDYGRTVFKSSNGYVYNAGGTFDSFNIARYSSILGVLNNVTYSGRGRITGSYSICDLGSYIAVGTIQYAAPNDFGILILASDLSLITYVSTKALGHEGAECILSYNNFLFVGERAYVSVFELVDSSLVYRDRILVDFPSVGSSTYWMRHILIPR